MTSVRKSNQQFYVTMSAFVLVGAMLIGMMLSFSGGTFSRHRTHAEMRAADIYVAES